MTPNISPFIPADIKVNGTYAPIVMWILTITRFLNVFFVMNTVSQKWTMNIRECPDMFIKVLRAIAVIRMEMKINNHINGQI